MGSAGGSGARSRSEKFRQLQSHSVASSEDVERVPSEPDCPRCCSAPPKQDAVELNIDARAIGGKRIPRDMSVGPRTRRLFVQSRRPALPRWRESSIGCPGIQDMNRRTAEVMAARPALREFGRAYGQLVDDGLRGRSGTAHGLCSGLVAAMYPVRRNGGYADGVDGVAARQYASPLSAIARAKNANSVE